MGRKKKSAGSELLGLVFVFQAIAMFFTFISPAIIAIMWIFIEIKTALKLSQFEGDLGALRNNIDKEFEEIAVLLTNGGEKGLSRRQDGFFDGRSREGKKLNSAISQRMSVARSKGLTANYFYKLLAQRSALRSAVFVWVAASAFLWWRNDQIFDSLSFLISGLLATGIAVLTYFIRREDIDIEPALNRV
ncbi:MAG: hypothetical protein WA954_00480 [Parerythrobacter sp.]